MDVKKMSTEALRVEKQKLEMLGFRGDHIPLEIKQPEVKAIPPLDLKEVAHILAQEIARIRGKIS